MMTLRTKRVLDYYVGGLLIACFKPLVLLLGKVLGRDHNLTPRGEICFIKLLGAGSLIIAFPALLGLRRRYPGLRISLLTTGRIAPFARTLGIFDRIHIVKDDSIGALIYTGFSSLLKIFGVDTVVDLEVYSRLSTVLSLLTCARNRIGFFMETVFWRRGFHTHLIFFNRFSGVYHFYEAVAVALGATPADVAECRGWLRRRLEVEGRPPSGGPRRIAIGHGCSELGLERRLNESQWLSVFQRHLARDENAEVLFLGSDVDRGLADGIIEVVAPSFPKANFRNLCGKMEPFESIRLLAQCDEFWGIDSVLLHYARLLGHRCVSFWGPTDPKAILRSVPGLKEEIYYEKIPCSPCIHVTEEPPCQGNNLCIQGLFNPIPEKHSIFWMV